MRQLLFAAALLSTQAAAASHCVRQGSIGNGADWSQAFGQLPDTLVRGDTSYVADGDYPAYHFDDPQSGVLIITIKKATQPMRAITPSRGRPWRAVRLERCTRPMAEVMRVAQTSP